MKLKTCPTLSCSDGKPTEEPAKGRGRGFGGESSLTLDLISTNHSALSFASYTLVKPKLFFCVCVSLEQNQKYILCYNFNFEFKARF